MKNILSVLCFAALSNLGQAQDLKSTPPTDPTKVEVPAAPKFKHIVCDEKKELKLRRLWQPANDSALRFKAIADNYQKQVEAAPDYQAAQADATAKRVAYSNAINGEMEASGCKGCRVLEDKDGSLYFTDEPAPQQGSAPAPDLVAPPPVPSVKQTSHGANSPNILSGGDVNVKIPVNAPAKISKKK